ncbi:MAG: hypothetical protein SGJ00_01445 [bacterium]|nr:hypothetical protein [bacterium]
MKNKNIIFYSLLMLLLGACSSSTFNGVNKVDDDVYWSAKDEPKTGKSYKDIEPWNKNKGPNASSYYNSNESGSQSLSASSAQSYSNQEDERGLIAYQTWLSKYTQNAALPAEDTIKQNNLLLADRENERNSRRFGSDRNYYYDDPYYNALSNNWGWTSFYAPIVRPGFYNWAPGWNVGLSWNNFNGFGINTGYNMGWGGMGYGYNSYSPWAYDPWYGGYGGFGGFNNPYYGGFYGHPYGGFGGFNNPYYGGFYGNRFGWGGGYCHNNGYGNYYGNNDVVTNRPIMRPRNSMGSSTVAPGSRPAGNAVAGEQRVKNDRPNYNESRPAIENTNSVRTNRPGGDLYMDKSGRPVYVSPNSRPEVSTGEPTNNRYSNRPGGDLRTGSDGRTEYVPARPRDAVDNSSRSNSNGFEGNYRPGRNGASDNGTPSRPGNSTPNYSSPQNDGGSDARPAYSSPGNTRPSNNPTPSYSAPPSRPSYSSPSMSRPSSGSAPRGGSPGGSVRPR